MRGPIAIITALLLIIGCAGLKGTDYDQLRRAEQAGAKITSYSQASAPDGDDVLIGTDVSDTTMAPTGTTKKYRLRDLPISDAAQAALDAKQDAVDVATDQEITDGTGTEPRLISPAQAKLSAQTHSGDIGPWQTGVSYSVDAIVANNGSVYVCTSAHTSGAVNEPGVGASWETYWSLSTGSSSDPAAIHDNQSGEIHAIIEKATGADADEFLLESAADAYAKRRTTWSSFWANYLKAKADTLYVSLIDLPGSWASPGADIGVGTPVAGSFTSVTITKTSGQPGRIALYEANSTDTHTAGLRGPASITGDGAYEGQMPNGRATSENMVQSWTNVGETGAGTPTDPYVQPINWVDLDDYAKIIASGTAALGTSQIASGACAAVVTVSATGVVTTDVISWGWSARPSQITGYGYSTDGALRIDAFPTAGNVNFEVCNQTNSALTPSAVTLNWKVLR